MFPAKQTQAENPLNNPRLLTNRNSKSEIGLWR